VFLNDHLLSLQNKLA